MPNLLKVFLPLLHGVKKHGLCLVGLGVDFSPKVFNLGLLFLHVDLLIFHFICSSFQPQRLGFETPSTLYQGVAKWLVSLLQGSFFP